MAPPLSSTLCLLLLLPFLFISSVVSQATVLKVVDVENPVLDVTPMVLVGSPKDVGSSKDVMMCERVMVSGISRLKLGNLHGVHRVTLVPSVAIPEKWHSKIQICSHRNSSLNSCQCEKDDWKSLYKGVWSSAISPYENRYIDVKFTGHVSGSVTITLDEEFQTWRVFALAFGFALLIVAPIVSSWVPFYYSSSMAIGVVLVIIILLFQGMKLLPTGRKSAFYLTIYGSAVGAGSFLLHQFSMLVNSVLSSFGLSEEMHSSVSVFVLVGIVLAGAGLGCWLVKKFIVSDDGNVDGAVAQFVKWAIRIIGVTSIFQSTLDTPTAFALVCGCIPVSILVTSINWDWSGDSSSYSVKSSIWSRNNGRLNVKPRAEFHSRSRKMGTQGTVWKSPNSSSEWSDSPVKGSKSKSKSKSRTPMKGRGEEDEDFYSTFHKTPQRKKFTKQEWDEFTKESTREAVAGLSASPEFTDWVVNNASRIQLLPDDSSEDSIGSGAGSSDETAVESSTGVGLSKWQFRR